MKKIAIVGSVGLPAKYGGWETLVDHLTSRLSSSFDFTVYCCAEKYPEKLATYNGAKLVYINLDANGMQSIIYDLWSMLKAIRYADTIVVLGVSGCVFMPVLKLISRKKFVINIDGLEWRRAKWSGFAKWFLKLSESAAVRYADQVVTDNKAIQDYVKTQYGRDSALIAYGGDHAVRPQRADAILAAYGLDRVKYAFKVCRIEPENNIDMIIEAFASAPTMDLVIVGNWDNSEYGTQLRQKYAGITHLHLLDPIYDHTILNQLRAACQVYVHGHSAGGTNPSLVEAMSLGLPVLAYGCIFNRETTNQQACFFDTSAELTELLNNLDEAKLRLLGQQMKQLADQLYTWDRISSGYANIF